VGASVAGVGASVGEAVGLAPYTGSAVGEGVGFFVATVGSVPVGQGVGLPVW
jgi:hypothetical protein